MMCRLNMPKEESAMKRLNSFLRGVAPIPLILAANLVAGPAAGQDVDTKGENELREQAQRVDKAAGRADAKHVTAKIVDEFKGKTFDFGDGKGARALTVADVQSFRQKGLGYGEISILLALASRTGQSPNAILQMRQSGMGWGQIARHYNVKLGPVIKSVKATERGVDRVARAEKAERAEKMEKAEKFEKPAKPERIERMERPERPERPGR
jgi:hypothetical protein